MAIQLAIVDGHTLIRYGLRELVARHGDIEIVAECQTAADAPRMIAAVRPDVVTVDVALPDGDGLHLARDLRDSYADLGIVMLTSKQEDDVLFRALETGVSAFVAKSAPVEEVLAAIRHAAVAAASFTASGLALALARRRSMQDKLALSPRETEVLNLLHKGLSIPSISVELYISVSTAKTYVARLYEKLGAANRAQALIAALHHGLIDYQQNVPALGAQAVPRPADARHSRSVADGQVVNRIPRRPHTESIPARIALAPAPGAIPGAIPAGSLWRLPESAASLAWCGVAGTAPVEMVLT
jgi:DNA-binding NarL/FixJ family response regulator